eukprot:CAMPEP_0177285632 /NCGR_PEP_ID=MMETSP0367-20130122/73167_1 /TAXON_ID=447022 ORGANISM="Scrippsiella hangoei-like, Strain SHHI-4" /NCGR_SAMPLE_ID=MMETSP0367 /ASSEMBLY_ACC=CAM_ASM_000362 /LENGTH=47 /DNA_ID= /DNA_START= /DNA_END= /DNA_ORIENTATION=
MPPPRDRVEASASKAPMIASSTPLEQSKASRKLAIVRPGWPIAVTSG